MPIPISLLDVRLTGELSSPAHAADWRIGLETSFLCHLRSDGETFAVYSVPGLYCEPVSAIHLYSHDLVNAVCAIMVPLRLVLLMDNRLN